ncbi:MAG: hypothetical protein H7227_00095 [Actinobacteria bacterium]|nr:hypothetical protein [Actinomycetota bacterium]
MKKFISSIAVGALVLVGGAISSAPANAATTPTLTLAERAAVYGLGAFPITATASVAGIVKVTADGVVIPGCEALATTTATPFIAKCLWTPSKGGAIVLSGTLTPTDAANFTTATATLTARVGLPSQGIVNPISMYVDTVLASGTSGVLAPRFGISCAITNEFILGQGIVFRVYANNADLAGAVMDSTNTAEAYIEVAGMKDPIPLSYGNHSGISFWTAVIRTGTGPGQYSTLGQISYKVTMRSKDLSSIKVLSTKLVRKMVNGVPVKVDGTQVYERIPAYRTVQLSVPLKGAVAAYVPNWTAASLLTVYAVPKA